VSEFLRTAAGVFAAVAPFGALPAFLVYAKQGADRLAVPRFALLSSVVAFAILVVAALVSDPFLDVIDVSPENFQFAAGAIMAPLAIRLLLTGESVGIPSDDDQHSQLSWLLPVAFPILAGPPAIAAALTYSARYGEETAIAGSALAVLATCLILAAGGYLASALRPVGLNALGRLSGAFLVFIAVELAIDGVRSV
jgi:multiple antibiotic resistance protein